VPTIPARQRAINTLGPDGGRVYDVLRSMSPKLSAYFAATLTGTRLPDDVDLRRRSAMRIGALACQGATDGQLERAVLSALDHHVEPAEIVEAMIHTIPYVGIPRPLNAIIASKGPLGQRAMLPVVLEEPTWSADQRMEVGLERILQAHPTAALDLRANLASIAPSLFDYIARAAFGDIYGRPGLTYAQRQPITIVALVAQGNVSNHVRTHVNGALTIGMTTSTIAGALVDVVDIVGTERTLQGLEIAAEVFAERGADKSALGQTW